LYIAAQKGHEECVALLLERGAKVDAADTVR
jgi:ankyrin repeat protein